MGLKRLGKGNWRSVSRYARVESRPAPCPRHPDSLYDMNRALTGGLNRIPRLFVPTRTPTQVASHAQKHFLRLQGVSKRKSRFSVMESVVRPRRPTSRSFVDKRSLASLSSSLRAQTRDHDGSNLPPSPPSPPGVWSAFNSPSGEDVQNGAWVTLRIMLVGILATNTPSAC